MPKKTLILTRKNCIHLKLCKHYSLIIILKLSNHMKMNPKLLCSNHLCKKITHLINLRLYKSPKLQKQNLQYYFFESFNL